MSIEVRQMLIKSHVQQKQTTDDIVLTEQALEEVKAEILSELKILVRELLHEQRER